MAVDAVFAAAPEAWPVLSQAVVAPELLDEHLPGARQEWQEVQEARFLSVLRLAELAAVEPLELEAPPVLALPVQRLLVVELLQALRIPAQVELRRSRRDAKLVVAPLPASSLTRA